MVSSSTKDFEDKSLCPVYAPSLVISHGKNHSKQTFCIPSDGSYHVRSIPEMRGMKCVASCDGWLLLKSYIANECHLFNPVTLTKIQLPLLRRGSYDVGVLTSPPCDSNCLIMLFSEKENSCIFCKVGDRIWKEQVMDHRNEKVIVRYMSAVSNNGKIYLCLCEGVTVIDIQSTPTGIETYQRELPTCLPGETYFTQYFVESCGEIFRVLKINLGTTDIVQRIVVFKLELATMVWEKVESIGDRNFLLGKPSMSVSAPEYGTKGNCIYFFAMDRTILYYFDMDEGTIMMTQSCPKKFTTYNEPFWDEPFWVVPNCKAQLKKEVADTTEIQENSTNLPTELLQKIFHSLYLDGCIRFRLASKTWISINLPVRSFHPETLLDSQHLPWLISLPNTKNNICHFYHPIYTDTYIMSLPQLAGATVRYAKFGWLLLSRERNSLFFFNPFTLETIKLPEILAPYHFVNISFSTPPNSADCVVFGHHSGNWLRVRISVYCKSDDRWISYSYKNGLDTFIPSHSNPIFHDGMFWSLSKNGKLGVFNTKETNAEDVWKVYSNPSVPDVDSLLSAQSLFFDVSTRSFIVEHDGEIFSVFVGFVGTPVCVYKLDQSNKTMMWNKVESLGEKIMFLSNTTTLLIHTCLKGTENRIYFPRFKENAGVFYSLSSGNYHSFGKQESLAGWINTCEYWNCTWFQTNK